MTTPKGLRRYIVDRDKGVTSQGITEVVVLGLIDDAGHEHTFVLSKVDAHLLATQLQTAALDAQGEHHKRYDE